MSLKRKLVMFTTAAVIAPLGLVVLPAAPASAHGYVSTPPSRQAQCARGTVPCDSIKWEPQSVEGPKGLRNCHGNVARFAELSENGKPWRATSVGRTVNFTWTFTVRHATKDFEYYVGNTRVATFEGYGQPPSPALTHTVNLGSNVSGRVRLLAVWNISDTPNAFYSCVDLQVGGGESPPPTNPPPTTPPATGTWAAGTAYAAGSVVTYNGTTFRAAQSHTALPGWEPPSTPALWQPV